ncbi:putative cysteine-rich receptor-like protein kinase 20 [Sorghum bicolor]|uniref:putative cysteine-rich receptor-like protein kinase 20 n=1 Tax=Sorghum bicolor TaxID=4558 RepID=UPI000B426641|nr:putative cysteine-rich receptor-like protein kinase 20 [Sorghum bicolor]|eukprot:XP_021309272.1 putative cysteine-rich receptor-like protein kinase 20 [Sorghum bicolor]
MAVLSTCFLFLLLHLLTAPPSHSAAAPEYAEYTCNGTTGNFTSGSAFAANLDRLIAELPGNASASPSLFASASIGPAPDTAYGLALCRGDMTDARACSSCLADAFAQLRRLCGGGDRDATFYADLCTARYSGGDFMFLSLTADVVDNSPVVNGMDANASTYPGWDAGNATSRSFFLSLVGTPFDEISMYGAYNSSSTRRLATAVMFINAALPTVYGLAQCTPDLAPAQCWHCFQGLGELNDQWYDGREGGRISGVRCSFRYEGYQFYQGTPDVRIGLHGGGPSSSSDDDSGTNASNHKKVLLVIALVVPIAVVCGLLVAGLLLIRAQRKRAAGKRRLPMKTRVQTRSRNSSKTEEALKLWRIEESSSGFTLYDFAELAAATGDFSDENLLGKGGFGPGKLPDGTEIAVKRLAAHSGQGLLEFKNETQLIAKLQHTNLVRLVGCCVKEEEKLLAYEYMPNRSLDCFIFDQQRGPLLNWEKRRRIIDGIAQGLLYLHKHSRVRIIHRDLKASNILLDKDLNPKISDFGMARIFGSNMTEANTNRVVGTYGYMAPEYASEGIFSVKSDVYSFGVLLLEIVSGKRNSSHRHHYGDFVNLLGYAWQLWREGRSFELIDPTLGECSEVAAIVRCVKVALLCVQDSATDRPTMADVTAMLVSRDAAAAAAASLPDPRRPPHFSLRVSSSDDGSSEVQTRSQGTASCSTNDLTITTIQEGR